MECLESLCNDEKETNIQKALYKKAAKVIAQANPWRSNPDGVRSILAFIQGPYIFEKLDGFYTVPNFLTFVLPEHFSPFIPEIEAVPGITVYKGIHETGIYEDVRRKNLAIYIEIPFELILAPKMEPPTRIHQIMSRIKELVGKWGYHV